MGFPFERWWRPYAVKYANRNQGHLFGEFFSVRHSDHPAFERQFAVFESLPAKIDEPISTKHGGFIIEIYTPEENALKILQPRLSHLRTALGTLRERGDEGVFAVLEDLGPEALRPGEWEALRPWADESVPETVKAAKEEELALLREVRCVIWRVLDRCYWSARDAETYGERKAAQKTWRRVGTIMGGDLRGIRPGEILNENEACHAYYARLFALLRALRLLEVWPWESTPARRVALVAEACGIDPEEFRAFLQLDSLGRRRDQVGLQAARPLQPEYAARIHTAKKLGITEKRLSNLLSTQWVPSSYK